MSGFVRVLERNCQGREVLWECSECGKPFTLGWGSKCNSCISIASRHAEMIAALKGIK